MERVGLEADLLGVVRNNGREIGLIEERVEERVEAVRELLQNDIDHAMKEVRGGGEGEEEGEDIDMGKRQLMIWSVIFVLKRGRSGDSGEECIQTNAKE